MYVQVIEMYESVKDKRMRQKPRGRPLVVVYTMIPPKVFYLHFHRT